MRNRAGLHAYLGQIPSGDAATKATLKIMVSIVRALLAKGADANAIAQLRARAIDITQGCADQDFFCEARALQHYVRDAIRYVRDVRDTETVQFPLVTLELAAGDCDDKAVLFCALAESIGFHTRFVAVKTDTDSYSHVLAQILIPHRGWTSAELIPVDESGTRVELGWFPPQARVFMLAHV